MTFIEAYHAERKEWKWSRTPEGSEALILAFCYCLSCRIQGIDPIPKLKEDVKKHESTTHYEHRRKEKAKG